MLAEGAGAAGAEATAVGENGCCGCGRGEDRFCGVPAHREGLVGPLLPDDVPPS